MKNKTSFCYLVKEELSLQEYSVEKKYSILSAFIKNNGTYKINGGEHSIVLKSKNPKIIKFIYQTINELFSTKCKIEMIKRNGKKSKTNYRVVIYEKIDEILEKIKVDFLENKLPQSLIANSNMISGYFVGAFLACGSINSPKTSNYHLEFFFKNDNYSMWFNKLLSRCYRGTFTPKISNRREGHIVYLKKSQQIADLLIFMGAVESTMKFENERLDRDFKNIGNRLDICDRANYRKTIKSSRKQIRQINFFKQNKLLEKIFSDVEIKGLELRLEKEDYSYQELQELFNSKYDYTISKSWFNHLFRKLDETYERRKKLQ